ncbi:MAG: MFS transporter [Actinomycetota bacterium]
MGAPPPPPPPNPSGPPPPPPPKLTPSSPPSDIRAAEDPAPRETEAHLDAGKLERIGLFRPLRVRDFALLWTGMTTSMLGDGVYLVAIAWQVFDLVNSPAALSIVLVAWNVPQVLLLLVGGVASDRFDRRAVMIAADVVRAVAIGILALLALTNSLEFWHMIVLVGLYGVGEAFFMPAFGAIVPDVVPQELLVQANSLDQFVRPIAMRFIGPALGGFLIVLNDGDAGLAFALDAVTFAISGVCILLMSSRYVRERVTAGEGTLFKEVGDGLRYVRSQPWLWASLLVAAIGMMCFSGPYQVLIPFIVRNDMGGSAGDLGAILAAGGVGAILGSILMSQRGLPRRHVTFLYVSWALGTFVMGAFAIAETTWQGMIVSFTMVVLFTVGMIVWGTLLHRFVPAGLLGRVSSLDWTVSISLVPVSLAVTGPIAGAVGHRQTLAAAAILGLCLMLPFLLVSGVHANEGGRRPKHLAPH